MLNIVIKFSSIFSFLIIYQINEHRRIFQAGQVPHAQTQTQQLVWYQPVGSHYYSR
jgi:hypothetical protein